MAMRVNKVLTIQYPNAAGIDIGSRSHFVAVPADRSTEPVREFGCYTEDLHTLARWLLDCGITIAALESTGVYWIPVFEVLESHGIEVMLVNARSVKNVSGRKSDVLDCQWLQQLMSFGLLSSAFRPPAEVCALRVVSRQRDSLLQDQARCVQRMEKSADPDESATLQRHHRYYGTNRTEHHSGDCGRGARSSRIGQAS